MYIFKFLSNLIDIIIIVFVAFQTLKNQPIFILFWQDSEEINLQTLILIFISLYYIHYYIYYTILISLFVIVLLLFYFKKKKKIFPTLFTRSASKRTRFIIFEIALFKPISLTISLVSYILSALLDFSSCIEL